VSPPGALSHDDGVFAEVFGQSTPGNVQNLSTHDPNFVKPKHRKS
jgi:hypothetical protein